MKAIYDATATAKGGCEGRVHWDSGRIDLLLTPPREMGGSGTGSNPGELFAAGYAACFHSAMKFVAGPRHLDIAGSCWFGPMRSSARPRTMRSRRAISRRCSA